MYDPSFAQFCVNMRSMEFEKTELSHKIITLYKRSDVTKMGFEFIEYNKDYKKDYIGHKIVYGQEMDVYNFRNKVRWFYLPYGGVHDVRLESFGSGYWTNLTTVMWDLVSDEDRIILSAKPVTIPRDQAERDAIGQHYAKLLPFVHNVDEVKKGATELSGCMITLYMRDDVTETGQVYIEYNKKRFSYGERLPFVYFALIVAEFIKPLIVGYTGACPIVMWDLLNDEDRITLSRVVPPHTKIPGGIRCSPYYGVRMPALGIEYKTRQHIADQIKTIVELNGVRCDIIVYEKEPIIRIICSDFEQVRVASASIHMENREHIMKHVVTLELPYVSKPNPEYDDRIVQWFSCKSY